MSQQIPHTDTGFRRVREDVYLMGCFLNLKRLAIHFRLLPSGRGPIVNLTIF
jgi:hypothetical protein